MNLLKVFTPSQVTTEQLLLVVESTGNQAPYENWLYLCCQVVASLHTFVQHRCRLSQQHMEQIARDPFGDLFMGFEGKQKPVLESIMSHHRLVISQYPKLSSEDMRSAIISYIASGHCAQQP